MSITCSQRHQSYLVNKRIDIMANKIGYPHTPGKECDYIVKKNGLYE